MNKNQKINLGIVAAVICVAAFVGGMGYLAGVYVATDDVIIAAPEPVIVEPEPIIINIIEPDPPIVIEVDGIGCVIAEEPVLHFYTRTQTVRFTVECDADILDYYRTAVDPTTIVDKPSTK